MVFLANAFLLLISVILAIPATLFFTQVLIGIRVRSNQRIEKETSITPGLKVLIAAHNEELVIQATLESLFDAAIPPSQILVVADNCSDKTAEIIRNMDVPVIERDDIHLRGKGHALAFGIEKLEEDPPDYVLILDADCTLDPHAPKALIDLSLEQHVVQPNYLIKAQPESDLGRRISGFLFKIKNLIRSNALSTLGCSVPLLGSGMLFPWSVITNTRFATGNIVEDTKIGLDLQLSGTKILFAPDINVSSYFPDTDAARESQSVRWEQGNLQIALEYVPKLIAAAFKNKDHRLAFSALHILVPPVSLLVLAILGLAFINTTSYLISGFHWALELNLFSLVIVFLAVLICWFFCGSEDLSAKELLVDLPIKTLKKVPHYFRILKFGKLEWVKTDRGK